MHSNGVEPRVRPIRSAPGRLAVSGGICVLVSARPETAAAPAAKGRRREAPGWCGEGWPESAIGIVARAVIRLGYVSGRVNVVRGVNAVVIRSSPCHSGTVVTVVGAGTRTGLGI